MCASLWKQNLHKSFVGACNHIHYHCTASFICSCDTIKKKKEQKAHWRSGLKTNTASGQSEVFEICFRLSRLNDIWSQPLKPDLPILKTELQGRNAMLLSCLLEMSTWTLVVVWLSKVQEAQLASLPFPFFVEIKPGVANFRIIGLADFFWSFRGHHSRYTRGYQGKTACSLLSSGRFNQNHR